MLRRPLKIVSLLTVIVGCITLITAAACGGDRMHPVLNDTTYSQVGQGQEYIAMELPSSISGPTLSGRINAMHSLGYELQETAAIHRGFTMLIFRRANILSPDQQLDR